MREEIKIKILQNMLREVTKKYDYFISLQEEVLKETFEKAIKDSLTGLYNRNYLIEVLRNLLSKAKRKNSEVLVIFLDLNNFKQINDSLGHEKGDRVLKKVASIFKKVFRDYDLIVRYGGDEFIIVIDDGKNIDVESLLKRVNESIEKEFKDFNLSIAYGIASSKETFDLEKLIMLADERMYTKKNLMKKAKNG